MNVTEFKRKIAEKYETNIDNIILTYGQKEFKGTSGSSNEHKVKFEPSNFVKQYILGEKKEHQIKIEDESIIPLRSGLGLNERSIVKVTFKVKPKTL